MSRTTGPLRILSVVGARPNFMKIAPFARAIREYNEAGPSRRVEHRLVHTGQHYDERMSAAFFEELRIPAPDVDLGVGSGTHAEQVGRTMIEFEKALGAWRPDWVVVVGDVNATCACAITAKKETVRLAHIEAGLRSFDLTMPEEINRLVTDRLSDALFATDRFAVENLRQEGARGRAVRLVGNIMIDTVRLSLSAAERLDVQDVAARNVIGRSDLPRIIGGNYGVVTLHRPSNVDSPDTLSALSSFLAHEVGSDQPVLWPVHPRTRNRLVEFGLWDELATVPGVVLMRPIGYLEMLRLNLGSRILFTDSGGLQEECCVLGTPCVTLRWNTERPVTLEENGGVSVLVGHDIGRLREAYRRKSREPRRPSVPPLWDGFTAPRVVQALTEWDS